MMDKNDIEKLFKAHYPQMLRVASALLHDGDMARDVVHDVFANLLSPKVRGEQPAQTPSLAQVAGTEAITPGYLLATVRNRCLNIIRDMDTRRRITSLYFSEVEEYDTEDWPDDATMARIYGIIKSELTPQTRRVMEMRFTNGLTFAKVAATLGISENAVYKHVRQALVIIRKNLKNG